VNVFVTGGSSPLGELVLPRLAAVHDVWALARSDAAAKLVEARGATVVTGALENGAGWPEMMRSADAVVHLAGLHLVDAIITHVDSHQPLTVISSASVRNPAHPQSSALRDAEARLAAAKLDALVLLRPTMIYGSSGDRNVRNLARMVARLPAVPRFVGGGVVQPVLADDVADAVLTTLGNMGRTEAELAGPVPMRLGDLVRDLARLLGTPVLPVPVPVGALAWLAANAGGRQSRTRHALAMLRHDRAVTPAGIETLGHSPTPLAEGLPLALSRYAGVS
jgi:uncharacterized protein YbjT (DUF2867 family)